MNERERVQVDDEISIGSLLQSGPKCSSLRCSLIVSYEEIFKIESKSNFRITLFRATSIHRYRVCLSRPRTLNEKLIHRRLFSRDDLWTRVSDKFEIRKWVNDNGLGGVVKMPKLYGAFDSVDEIPDEVYVGDFVIKANWASGYNIFTREVGANKDRVDRTLRRWLSEPYKPTRLIWAAHQIERKYVVEERLKSSSGGVPEDFKFFVFHGEVMLCQVDLDRFKGHRRLFLDAKGKKIDMVWRVPKSSKARPLLDEYKIDVDRYEAMKARAEAVGRHFDFARIDLYSVDGEVYLGEITQTPGSGFEKISPSRMDHELGEKWFYPHEGLQIYGSNVSDGSKSFR